MSKRTVRRVKRYGKSRRVRRQGKSRKIRRNKTRKLRGGMCEGLKEFMGFNVSKDRKQLDKLLEQQDELISRIKDPSTSTDAKNLLKIQLQNVHDQISELQTKYGVDSTK